jgi:Prp8 binding protein
MDGSEDTTSKRSKRSTALITTTNGTDEDGVPKRTSGLHAPTMLLSGHEGAIHSVKFDPSGKCLASASFDRQIFLWNVYGDCENYMMLKGHKNAILDLHFTKDRIYTASADKTVCMWDAEVGQRVRKWNAHSSFVNSCCPLNNKENSLIVSGSDDGMTKLWDARSKKVVKEFENKFQITSVAFSKDGDTIFAGSVDENIRAWDLRNDSVSFTLKGHTDIVTGISLSPDGNHLLSNAMDRRMYIWDVRPFVTTPSRCMKRFEGHSHNFEKMLLRCSWSSDGRQVSAGSSDRCVYVWDVSNQEILYQLPGHKGSVNEVAFHPNEPIIASCSSDKNIFLGELS